MSYLYKKSLIEVFEIYSNDNNHLSNKTLKKMRNYIKLYGYEIMDKTIEEINRNKIDQVLKLNINNKKLVAYICVLLKYVGTKN